MGVSRPKRSFDREFKLQVVRQLLGGEKRLSQLCREHQLSATLLRRWKEQYEQQGEAAWPELGDWVVGPDAEQRIKELEAALGRAHLENELLRRALKQAEKGGFTLQDKREVITASGDLLAQLPLARACAVLDLGRESYYRVGFQQASERGRPGRPCRADPVLWEALEQVVLEFPGYGYLRVTKQLQRAGFQVNPKRVYRLMREADWLQERVRGTVRTTDSEHGFPIYPNLLTACGWRALTAPNQAWGADLTYIRLGRGFCYLAVLLDLFSRRIVGWNLSESLEATVAIAALEMALASRQPSPGWIHHSDRGVQYACREYVQRLKQAEARISMAAVGAPKENAPTERWMRTVKEEEVELEEYDSFPEAKQGIGRFIEEVYNRKRLHSGLGYRPPSEFEEILAAGILH